MSIGQINQEIDILDEIAPFTPNYFTNITNRNNLLVGTIFVQQNTQASQINGISTQMNATSSSMNSMMINTTNYALVGKQSAESSLQSSVAAETSYQNTVTLLEDVDITGTGGYTIEAVDDMMSRQRNLQLAGLNLF